MAGKLHSTKTVVFDIDGCISNDEWRLHLIADSGEDRFQAYHARLQDDKPLPVGLDVLKDHIRAGDEIIFITARPDSVREETRQWLKRLSAHLDSFALYMRRSDEEGVSAVTIKGRCLADISELGTVIDIAYDDRPDIVQMYIERGIDAWILDKVGKRKPLPGEKATISYHEKPATVALRVPVADILERAGGTFRERNAIYKDNAKNVGNVMLALFPNGVQLKNASDHEMYHLFELLVVKLTRFANSGLTHEDSIHDLMVYAAMCENLAAKHQIQFQPQPESA